MARKSASPDPVKGKGPKQTPWEAIGISESTYYRRKKAGKLPPEAIPAPVKKTVKKVRTVKSDSDRTSSNDSQKKDKPWLIKPGEVRNPAGRKPGSRNKLTEAFISAMCADFEENGAEAIMACRKSKPETYLTVMARIIPQQHEVGEAGAFAEMSDAELDAFIIANAKKYAENRKYH
jgi:hypothetical protein